MNENNENKIFYTKDIQGTDMCILNEWEHYGLYNPCTWTIVKKIADKEFKIKSIKNKPIVYIGNDFLKLIEKLPDIQKLKNKKKK